jgi:fluoride exporter
MTSSAHLLWLAIAGVAGVLCRAGVSTVVGRVGGDGFPWAVTIVNVTGSFAFAAIAAATPIRFLPTGFEKILLVGLLGGFTTFSSFSYETVRLVQAGHTTAAVGFVAANNIGGLLAVWLGLTVFAGRAT